MTAKKDGINKIGNVRWSVRARTVATKTQKLVMYVLSSYRSDQKYETIYYIIIKFWNFTEFTWYNNINPLTPNDLHISRTAPLTGKRCILYIYSTKVGTEYFKHALYSPFFSLQNAVCFIMLTCLVPVLFTFYIQVVLKLKKIIIIPAPKG